MNTLLLDRTTWDLVLDTSGNIALATEPYAVEQDVASACRLFVGELWYDTIQGVPYFYKILGQSTPVASIKALFVRAALTVPTVISAKCYLISTTRRSVTGQVQFKTQNGLSSFVNVVSSKPILTTADGSADLTNVNDVILTRRY